MSWRSRGSGSSAWRQGLTQLRQESAAKGYATSQSLRDVLETLRAAAGEAQDNELADDLSFLVQQLVGPQPSLAASTPGGTTRDALTQEAAALCRLLTSLVSTRTISLHGPAANLILSALRQWSDAAQNDANTPTSLRRQSSLPADTVSVSTGSGVTASGYGNAASTAADGLIPPASPPPPPQAAAAATASLPVEAVTALAALLPDHLGVLSEHERAAQLVALMSLLVPPPSQSQSRGPEGARGRGGTASASDHLEMRIQALTALAACCGGGGVSGGGGLTADEAASLLSGAVTLLQSCSSRSSRPVEDATHSRLYTALLRALQAALGEARTAWVARAAMLVEGLQRFFTYGAQASITATAGGSSPAAAGPSAAAEGGGRYRPPHLRRRESQADGGLAWSDSDVSDTEHAAAAGGLGSGAGAQAAAVDRFRSSRVRLAVLSCIQAMAKSDPRVMHAHWSALLPLQNPLQPRPLTPNLITVLLYDPLIKVRALAAATVASLLDGPAQRAILAVAEAKSMSTRAPVRGFLTLSLSLGQLLLASHAGLLHAVATEGSALVLPGLLRALVVLMAASPYERLPPELLPEVLKVLRTRWGVLSAAAAAANPVSVPVSAPAGTTTTAPGELGPIQAAYLACLAECFSTKHPSAGLAAFLQQRQEQQQQQQQEQQQCCPSPRSSEVRGGGDGGGGSGGGGGDSTQQLVRDLLAVGRDATAAAVLRIEALAALRGLAAHYTAALPLDVWDDLRATAAMGLSCSPSPQAPGGLRAGPPSRSSSSSSLGTVSSTHGSSGRAGDRARGRAQASMKGAEASSPWSSPSGGGGGGSGGGVPQTAAGAGAATSSSNSSPEDKAAQLSVKLLSDYLSALARQYGVSRTDAGNGAGPGDVDSGLPGPPPSPVFVPLAAAVARQQQHQAGLSPVSVRSDVEREAGVQRLVSMWQDAVAVLVPAATSHTSYMVRSAGLACLGEVPEPVFSSLVPRVQQQQILTLLNDAAASDVVPAVRAAACKALGVVAAFHAVLAKPQLTDQVMRALLPGLQDAVMSVRIAAGWAVANLCDAYRWRLELPTTAAAAVDGGEAESDGSEQRQRVQVQCAASHEHASASVHGVTAMSPTRRIGSPPLAPPPPSLEPHHYRQLAALCGAAITATQDADKVRANGVRAVGNLLALLTPEMAPGLAAAAGGAVALAADKNLSSWRAGRRDDSPAVGGGGGFGGGNKGGRDRPDGRHRPAAGITSEYHSRPSTGRNGPVSDLARVGGGVSSAGGSGAEGLQLDVWLDSALTCLQTTLTTGGMKVQWNACCAAHGLLRNPLLLAHPHVAARVAPLLLLLVMLVRESANFKIRTHAAAALAALPSRGAYGDVLPDALLVVAGALESIANGGIGDASASAPSLTRTVSGGAGAEGDQGDADGNGDGGDGRFPNFRYTVGLSLQLRATLLHLLALAQPTDARRVREALARRADILHTCLREQLAEAVQPLRAVSAVARGACPRSRPDERGSGGSGGVRGMETASAAASGVDRGSRASGVLHVDVDLPADPFGLSGGRGSSPGRSAAARGLAGLLEGLNLGTAGNELARSDCTSGTSNASDPPLCTARLYKDGSGGAGCVGGSRPSLAVFVDGGEDEQLQLSRGRVAALVAPLRGFANLLAQLGPSVDAVLRDVQQALAQLPPS